MMMESYECSSSVDEEEDTTRRDLVLSDIHIENVPIEKRLDGCTSQIDFTLPSAACSNDQEYDEDGDLIIKRAQKYTFLIEHCLETSLNEVGLQLWKASLYLCDYLIANSSSVFNQTTQVVELGAGVGLTTLVSALFADRITCTDLESIVKIAENNYMTNKATIDSLRVSNPLHYQVLFDSLDWSKHDHLFCSQQQQHLQTANLFLAADVIYDDEITIAFLNTLFKLMSCLVNQPKCALIALEKRINFETSTLGEAASCYDLFAQSMVELNDYTSEEGIEYRTELLTIDHLPKHMINYDRSEHLVIWKVVTNIQKK